MSSSITKVTVDGVDYSVAPLEPEHHDNPSPAFPMAVTPQVARNWLRYNYRNRRVRKGGKRDYASDMASGRHDINGTSVTFSRPLKDGEDPEVPAGSVMLIDGQHRLQACVDSGQPFVVYVAYGIKPEARRTVDTGIKRQLSDVFAMDGETSALVLASVTKRAYFWAQGDQHLNMREDSFTHTEAQLFLAQNPELRRSTEVAQRAHHGFKLTTGQNLRQSLTGLAHWILMQADETKAPEFFERLGDGADMPIDHPVNALRRRLVKDRTQKVQIATRREIYNVPDWQMLCYYIRAWNVYMTGPNVDGSYPEFALVGRNDSEKMPRILRAIDVQRMQQEKIDALRSEGS